MNNYNNRREIDPVTLWLRRICSAIGLGVIIGILFYLGEYLADHYFSLIVNVYCTAVLTGVFLYGIHYFIHISKRQITAKKNAKRAKKANKERLLEYHDHRNHHYFR